MKKKVFTSRLPRSGEKGFSLIEILIAMLILAVGVLGIAALQFKGLQYSNDAHFRSQISNLVTDIADRMRINKTNAASYVSTYTLTTTRPSGCNEVTGASATNDLNCWRGQVWDALPPLSKVNISDAGGGLYTITLGWPDRETVAANDTRDLLFTFQP